MSKQLVCQRYILKIHSSRLRKAKWDLTLPLAEARRNEELVSISDSQVLRWLDDLNGVVDAEETARRIRAEIREVRKCPNDLSSRRRLRKLYDELDRVQYKPDYMCLIIDREKDYRRAVRGFSINGLKYHRLLGTNGGVKCSTIVFLADRHLEEIRRRIDNGRDMEKPLVPAKFEAYRALACSGSSPVSIPNGVLVVDDCVTRFKSDVVYLDDEKDGEPVMEARSEVDIELDESDGYGLLLPSLADRWASELGLDYRPSGFNTRFSFEKGMVFTFNFVEFADKVAGTYSITDAWGTPRDIRYIELILTTSQLKLWDSYPNWEAYRDACVSNGYTFGVTKVCPKELESERDLNYQFIQSYDLSDEDIDELISPTVQEIHDVLGGDWRKSLLFLRGIGMTEDNADDGDDDFVKALMVEPSLIDDPYVHGRVFQAIRKRIDDAKIGVLKVHGNYSIISGDPYSLCQNIFGMEVTGLLGAGEIYNKYWVDREADKLACFRAPMSCHNNIRAVKVCRTEEASYWYRYMTTCTIMNSWDTAAHALNGADKDGDLVMLTDDRVLVDRMRELPAIMCIQRKASKQVVTEEALVEANINSFGDDIGKITNRVTSMFDVQSKFDPGSIEYEILSYRIKCGQLFQQNAIDKAKGIVSKPMPKEWYDHHAAAEIEDPEKREVFLSILANKKPYFMRYIYPDLMRQYNTYISNTDKKAVREFSKTVGELMASSGEDLTDDEREFLRYYELLMPVGMGRCVMNEICRKIEREFDGCVTRHNSQTDFDYEILRSSAVTSYTRAQFNAVAKIRNDHERKVRDYVVLASRERIDPDESSSTLRMMQDEFRAACDAVCSNADDLCDILLDLCYRQERARGFVWSVCGKEIVRNLLRRNGWKLHFPTMDDDGDIEYRGRRFSMCEVDVSGRDDDCEEERTA